MPNQIYVKTPENPPHCHVPLIDIASRNKNILQIYTERQIPLACELIILIKINNYLINFLAL
jgi:hypothetical protein